MVQVHDLVTAAEKLRGAQAAEFEARATLIGLTRAFQRSELPDAAVQFIEDRSSELIPDGKFTGTVSLHVLLSALEDAWRAGQHYEHERERV